MEPEPKLTRRVLRDGDDRVRQGAGWHLTAVMGPDGQVQLWDIYVEEKWIGSRRTEAQCYQELRNHGIEPIRGKPLGGPC